MATIGFVGDYAILPLPRKVSENFLLVIIVNENKAKMIFIAFNHNR